MNLTILPALVILGLTTVCPAQSKGPSEPDKKPAPAGTLTITDKGEKKEQPRVGVMNESLVLAPGDLPVVVQQVELAAAKLFGTSDEAGVMPNVIYAPGTEGLTVPAPLRVRQVTPVQALTLIAAAAGCTLEPIRAPDELMGSTGPKVIGYQFVLPGPRGLLSASGFQFSNRATTATKPAGGRNDSNFTGAGSISVEQPAAVLRPIPTAVPNPPVTGTVGTGGFGTVNSYDPAGPASGGIAGDFVNTLVLGRAPNAPTVRVYALGPIMGGLSKDELNEKENALQEMVLVAMELAGRGSERPTLHFHRGTMTLIVKGTAVDHDVVDQIIRAAKENAETEAKLEQLIRAAKEEAESAAKNEGGFGGKQ